MARPGRDSRKYNVPPSPPFSARGNGRRPAAQALAVVFALLVSVSSADAKSIRSAREAVVDETLRYLNVPYLWGGEHPRTGLDCSGFVQLVFRRAGLALPRVARDQFRQTVALRPANVHPGDLLFFSMRHPGSRKVDHVGIYMGRGWFVHASVTNGIHVEQIAKPYYLSRLIGARKYRGF